MKCLPNKKVRERGREREDERKKEGGEKREGWQKEGKREREKEVEEGEGKSFSVSSARLLWCSNVSCSAHDWLSSIPDGVARGHDLLTLRFLTSPIRNYYYYYCTARDCYFHWWCGRLFSQPIRLLLAHPSCCPSSSSLLLFSSLLLRRKTVCLCKKTVVFSFVDAWMVV